MKILFKNFCPDVESLKILNKLAINKLGSFMHKYTKLNYYFPLRQYRNWPTNDIVAWSRWWHYAWLATVANFCTNLYIYNIA